MGYHFSLRTPSSGNIPYSVLRTWRGFMHEPRPDYEFQSFPAGISLIGPKPVIHGFFFVQKRYGPAQFQWIGIFVPFSFLLLVHDSCRECDHRPDVAIIPFSFFFLFWQRPFESWHMLAILRFATGKKWTSGTERAGPRRYHTQGTSLKENQRASGDGRPCLKENQGRSDRFEGNQSDARTAQ